MLDFPIVDTHVHLWNPGRLRYPWLDGDPLLNRPYLLADYADATQSQRVEQIVFMQAEVDPAQFMDEANWVSELAQQDRRIAAIIPWAPLENGDAARPALERLAAIPRITGVRRIIQYEPEIDFCLRPGFIRGVQALADYGLSFELCISHVQLENTITLVRQCPNVRFMLDHIGKPDIKQHVLDPWRAEIETLAAMDNVCCKVSGLLNEADHTRWTKQDLKPYLDHVLACFGFERVAFGGDWPVILRAGRWHDWVEALLWALSGASHDELKKLFHDNAAAFYRLAS